MPGAPFLLPLRCLLDGEATSKWTCLRRVSAPNSADISGGALGASVAGGHYYGHVVVCELGQRQAVGAGDVIGDLKGGSSSGRVVGREQVARVRSSAILVDLVNRDGQSGTDRDLSDIVCSNGSLDAAEDVDVAIQLRTATDAGGVGADLRITDDGRVLLAGANERAVPCNGRVHRVSDRVARDTCDGQDDTVPPRKRKEGGGNQDDAIHGEGERRRTKDERRKKGKGKKT